MLVKYMTTRLSGGGGYTMIGWRNGSTAEMLFLYIVISSNNTFYYMQKSSSYTSTGTQISQIYLQDWWLGQTPIIRLAMDSTNTSLLFSKDGVTFCRMWYAGKSAHITTPTEVFIGVCGLMGPPKILLYHYEEVQE